MHKLARMFLLSIVALFGTAAFAQPYEERRQSFSQAQLDQVLAPIALYPDSLLSQILMAATYPEDVFEAAGHTRSSGLRGEEGVRAVENAPWDPSVISLAAFPEILAMMDERRDWTVRLGDAYVAQPEQVMDTIQELRRRADEAGNLRSSEEISVQRSGDYYVIEPPAPDVVYVPYYDSRVVYGNWWWPDYQPVYWNPWPGYSYRSGYGGFGWGYGVRLSSGFFFGSLDWRHRYVRYSNHRPWYFRGQTYRQGYRWTHNRDHRNVVRDSRWRGADRDGWRGERRDGGQARDRGNRGERRDGWQGRGDRGERIDRRDGSGRDRRSQAAPAPRAATPQPVAPQGFVSRRYERSDPQVREQVRAQRVQARERGENRASNPRVQPREARAVNVPRAAQVPRAERPAPSPRAVEQRAPQAEQRAPQAERRAPQAERRAPPAERPGRNLGPDNRSFVPRDHSGG